MNNPYNILVAGVGGQGNLVCGKALAEAAIHNDLRPVLGDTFGASRRGGSVLTHLRIADSDLGPLIPEGHASLILGMEPIESLRVAIKYASKKTIIVTSTMPVQSPSTLSGEYKYPERAEIISALDGLSSGVYSIDPEPILDRIGTYRVLNVFMLGLLAGLQLVPLSKKDIEIGVTKVVRMDTNNRDAFNSGYEEGSHMRPS